MYRQGCKCSKAKQSEAADVIDVRLVKLLKPFVLTDSQLQNVFELFGNEIRTGLNKSTRSKAVIKCYVTYVQDLPTGNEVGKYLALDLGGSNFRVLLVRLKEGHDALVESKIFALPKEILVGTAVQLFDHIAECLAIFVKELKVNTELLPLGFTFSFPCVQTGLTKALLVRWTKGFQVSGVVQEDVAHLLKQAIARRGDTDIQVVAVLNDTTGTLMSCAHRNPDCRVGVIVGTGCNACYVERVAEVDMLEPEYKKDKKYVVINTEWGAFGDNGTLDFIRTNFDKEIDAKSLNLRTQIFEKMIAGMYLGNLVRMNVIKALDQDLIFAEAQNKKQLIKMLTDDTECFETNMISEIEDDRFPECKKTRAIIQKVLGIKNAALEDCRKLLYICECISKRSASLVAVAISSLVNKVNNPKVIVGIDGSVYRFHPKYDAYMRVTMKKFVNPKIEFDLMLSEDGSGRGAALVAAIASRKN